MVSALGNRVCSSLLAGARVVTANLFSRLRVIASNFRALGNSGSKAVIHSGQFYFKSYVLRRYPRLT